MSCTPGPVRWVPRINQISNLASASTAVPIDPAGASRCSSCPERLITQYSNHARIIRELVPTKLWTFAGSAGDRLSRLPPNPSLNPTRELPNDDAVAYDLGAA